MGKKAVVLLSGGLDSATVLAIAQAQEYACYTLSFDYGQRHNTELQAAQRLAEAMNTVSHKVLTLDLSSIGGSALTDPTLAIPAHGRADRGDIPITYVPARNTVFLSLALGWAEVLGARTLFIGANAVDYAGYPDCRPAYLKAFEHLANLATKAGVAGDHFTVKAPLLTLSKADIIRQGVDLGVDYRLTVSCYQADDHGRACGICDSCYYRKKGFADAGLPDTTRYADTATNAGG